MALEFCFFDKDVSPHAVTVIQTLQQSNQVDMSKAFSED
jgi:hypothetical protein